MESKNDQSLGSWVVAGKPVGEQPKIGHLYEIRDARKGVFKARVDRITGMFADLTIVDGVAGAVMSYNVRYEGERVTVRDVLTYFIPIDEPIGAGDNQKSC